MICLGIEFCHDATHYTTSPLTERVAGPDNAMPRDRVLS